MSGRTIRAEALDAAAFAAFGDVLEAAGASFPINEGMTDRFHDRARVEVLDGRPGISLARARPYALPLRLDLMERHPLGSQAWLPLEGGPWLVVVAPDEAGRPGRPRAFLPPPGVGVNYLRNAWHAVVTPLERAQTFAVVDRIGPGRNLQEHRFAEPWTITG
jgi:ureidoglycolate lyase